MSGDFRGVRKRRCSGGSVCVRKWSDEATLVLRKVGGIEKIKGSACADRQVA